MPKDRNGASLHVGDIVRVMDSMSPCPGNLGEITNINGEYINVQIPVLGVGMVDCDLFGSEMTRVVKRNIR